MFKWIWKRHFNVHHKHLTQYKNPPFRLQTPGFDTEATWAQSASSDLFWAFISEAYFSF
jgi:hypothetical protein